MRRPSRRQNRRYAPSPPEPPARPARLPLGNSGRSADFPARHPGCRLDSAGSGDPSPAVVCNPAGIATYGKKDNNTRGSSVPTGSMDIQSLRGQTPRGEIPANDGFCLVSFALPISLHRQSRRRVHRSSSAFDRVGPRAPGRGTTPLIRFSCLRGSIGMSDCPENSGDCLARPGSGPSFDVASRIHSTSTPCPVDPRGTLT